MTRPHTALTATELMKELMALNLKLQKLREAASAVVACVGYDLHMEQAIERLRAAVAASEQEDP